MPFVNTVDLIGDEALSTSIIDRSITEIADNLVTSIGDFAFQGCNALVKADFLNATSIGDYSFQQCSVLAALVLRSTTMCSLYSSNSLVSSLIASKKGYIYVPAALVDTYKAATNWSTYAKQFRALEDYTVDGTTTGELDPTKI